MTGKTTELSLILPVARQLALDVPDAAAWHRADVALGQCYGHRLFTILAYDKRVGLMQRVYSSRPDINAVGGIKRVTQSRWVEQVLVQGEGYLGSSADDLRSVFSDHATLLAHGLASVMNISVRIGGEVVGSLNLLDEAGHYDRVDRSAGCVVAQLLAPRLQAHAAGFKVPANLDDLDTV
ncbi:hypothetical protein [Bordetella petrii]|uniref:GAF domain-containing protein n=1 Tax=Bordetella petrii (strain ATCC BAA-461 / DSM 12804 / CCUG 43448 / CIP 107267 / Se-1111R) TaxID=340100 RepID=A9IDR6_BORPD|nr:hypothetical protein [Bordetella petrii]CAP41598.1 unnamed protein product [Bordetella petrii]